MYSRIPVALERYSKQYIQRFTWEGFKTFDLILRHGEGRLDLEQLYAMVLPSAYKTATTKFGANLLLRLVEQTSLTFLTQTSTQVQYSAPAQRQRMVLRLLPYINALAMHIEGHK